MDIGFLEQTEYIMDAWEKSVSENPNALVLTDERHPRGISRRTVDELSGKVYNAIMRSVKHVETYQNRAIFGAILLTPLCIIATVQLEKAARNLFNRVLISKQSRNNRGTILPRREFPGLPHNPSHRNQDIQKASDGGIRKTHPVQYWKRTSGSAAKSGFHS